MWTFCSEPRWTAVIQGVRRWRGDGRAWRVWIVCIRAAVIETLDSGKVNGELEVADDWTLPGGEMEVKATLGTCSAFRSLGRGRSFRFSYRRHAAQPGPRPWEKAKIRRCRGRELRLYKGRLRAQTATGAALKDSVSRLARAPSSRSGKRRKSSRPSFANEGARTPERFQVVAT
jgi:hypothetical protein